RTWPIGLKSGGGARASIIYRLRRDGFNTLADQVEAHEISAQHAARLAGFGDNRKRLRKGEVALPEKTARKFFAQFNKFNNAHPSRIAENGWPEKSNSPALRQLDKPTPAKIDVKALIG